MTMKDEWLRAAMTDDKLVVDLLLRLKQSPESSSCRSMKPPPLPTSNLTLPPFDWGIRQPRSKLSTSCSSSSAKKESRRRSPTTPLSWSGGCCGGGASPSDGYEESTTTSRRSCSSAAVLSDRIGSGGGRSKGAATNENTTSSNGKRPRRKKTFKELKEEETSLIKERTHLNKQLVSLRSTLEEQRALNENLKRIKLDLPVESGLKSEPIGKFSINCSTTSTGEACCTTVLEDDPLSMQHVRSEAVFVTGSSSSSVEHKDPMPQEDGPAGFELPDLNAMPDLNMIPVEEDVVVGVRAC